MIVRVLGSAAGGGVPQWNCACANCTAAREGRAPRRTQSTVAVSADGERWWLLNCSPDVAAQIESFGPLQPRSLRGTPIDGIALTDANVDHIGGLTVLRQSGDHRFVVRSSAVVRDIATAQPAFAPFAQPPHRWIVDDGACESLAVRGFDVPGTTPGYDGRRSVAGAVTAYEIRDARGGMTLLFAPIFAAIDDALAAAVARADVAFLDGSFWTDDELGAQSLMPKRARDLGHQPVGGADGSLAALQRIAPRARIVFTHLNNSNPMLDPASEAARRVREAGYDVAYDGLEIGREAPATA